MKATLLTVLAIGGISLAGILVAPLILKLVGLNRYSAESSTLSALVFTLSLATFLVLSYLQTNPEFEIRDMTVDLGLVKFTQGAIVVGDLCSKGELVSISMPPGIYRAEADQRCYMEKSRGLKNSTEIWPTKLRLISIEPVSHCTPQNERICSDSHYVYVAEASLKEMQTQDPNMSALLRAAWKQARPGSAPVVCLRRTDGEVFGFLMNAGEYAFPLTTAIRGDGQFLLTIDLRGPDGKNSVAAPIAEG